MKPYAYVLAFSPEKTGEFFAWSPNSATALKISLLKAELFLLQAKKEREGKKKKKAAEKSESSFI